MKIELTVEELEQVVGGRYGWGGLYPYMDKALKKLFGKDEEALVPIPYYKEKMTAEKEDKFTPIEDRQEVYSWA